MDSETPIWKWTAALVGVVVACFCLGYFVLGPSARPGGSSVASNNTPTSGVGIITEAPPAPRPSAPSILIQERTDEIEAKRRKDAEEARQKEEAEAQKRADEEAKKKAQETANKKAEEEAKVQATATPPPPPNQATNPENTSTPVTTEETPADHSKNATNDNVKSGESKPADTKPIEPKTTETPATPKPEPVTVKPEPATPKPTPADTLYRVRVGSYPARDAAKSIASELSGRGYSATVVGAEGAFQVQVGAFKSRDKAESVQKELSANGYDASVTP